MAKMRITTALSVAGVLAAGGAAYALNVNVLGSSGAPQTSIALQDASLNVESTSAPVEGDVTVTEVSSAATTVTYQVGDAGTVIVDISNGQVAIASAVPNSGWTAEPARADGTGSAKIHFVSGTNRIEVLVTMVDGKPSVTASVDARPGGIAVNPTKPTMPGSSVDDDDNEDDEHRGGDDREDDGDHEDGPEFEHEDDD